MPAKQKAPSVREAVSSDGLLIPAKIAPLVLNLRHEKMILDSDRAELYGVGTKALNQAVQRNLDRFPTPSPNKASPSCGPSSNSGGWLAL